MHEKMIKKYLNQLVEEKGTEKPVGLTSTEKVQGVEDKTNKDAMKDVKKTMADYEKASKSKDTNAIEPVMDKDSKTQAEFVEDNQQLGGMQALQYDNPPNEAFVERQKMAIEGDSKMGNKTYTGEENGNTEPVWGASKADLGKNIVDRTKRAKERTDAATPNITSFGDDIELGGDKAIKRKVAVESKENKENNITETKTNKMKRLRFKTPFNGKENAIKLIPEAYKVDRKEFEMTDNNETYKIRWEGSLTEGKAEVLQEANQHFINEDMAKIKHLMGYNSKSTLGTLKGSDRISENVKFDDIWSKAKGLVAEATKGNKKPVISEAKGTLNEMEKGRFTVWCKKEGFEGPSEACAKKAMSGDNKDVHKMATFYRNTVEGKM